MKTYKTLCECWDKTPSSVLKEDIGAGAVQLGSAAIAPIVTEILLKYLKEARTAIMSSAGPEEAYQKLTTIMSEDKMFLPTRRIFLQLLDQRLRNLSLSSTDPDWQLKMYKVVNKVIKKARFATAVASIGTAASGIATMANG